MKNKALLALVEQLIMILIFALSSALCLQAFFTAKQVSMENVNRDYAVLQAQNAAELLKYYRGNLHLASEHMGGNAEDSCWNIYFDKNWTETDQEISYSMIATLHDQPYDFLGEATISVYNNDNQLLYQLSTAWQEVDVQ